MNWHEALMNIKRSVNPGNVVAAWFEAIENRIAELEDQLNRPVLKTEWQQAQDRIAELEGYVETSIDKSLTQSREITRLRNLLMLVRDQLAEAQTSVHALETDLHLSNSQLAEAQKDVDLYLSALKIIRASTSEWGWTLARIAGAAIDGGAK